MIKINTFSTAETGKSDVARRKGRGLRYLLSLVFLCWIHTLVAQSSCCQTLRTRGQEAFNKKDYATAIKHWTSGKKCSDAATKCTDLDALIQKAKAEQQKQQNAAAERKWQEDAKAEQARQAKIAEQQRLAREKAADDAWEITRAADSKAAYETFIKKYPDSRYLRAARDRIAAIDKAAEPAPGSLAPGSGTTTKPASKLPAAIQQLETDMIPVTGGTFTMGWQSGRDGSGYDDEKPAHQVSVRNFSIGRYEVTQAQWRAVMGSDPPELYNKGCDQCPVERVSWNDIQDFLKKLNSLTGKRYRLPTEAEWEYAARGGNRSGSYLYSGSNNIDAVAWYDDNAKSGNTNGAEKTTRPVGGKKANELGLYDMSGNVWEWCEDDWHGNYQGAPTDGRAWVDSPRGSYRVYRGGGWFNDAGHCRAAYRGYNSPTLRNNGLGFRLALQ
jgi:formylglycine-generating enzyme required for sulfatase activity